MSQARIELLQNKDAIMDKFIRHGMVDLLFVDTINECAMYLLTNDWNNEDMILAEFILRYSNMIWENVDTDRLPIEDGVYDLLREKFKSYGGIPPVGGVPINPNVNIKCSSQDDYNVTPVTSPMITPATIMTPYLESDDLLYTDMLLHKAPITRNDILVTPASIAMDISKRSRNTTHEYPDLVGTLDKCKFVMKYQAQEKGVLNDYKVKVLERDFFGEHVKAGILDPERIFSMILMLKFDGVSIEGDVVNNVYTSRGDAIGGLATDLTPIMVNYRFPNKPHNIDEAFGVQFEAIMTYSNLHRYNMARGYNYKNCRTAISGLFNSSDAWKYMEYVTLVPLASSLDLPKDVELEFLNRYYTRGVHNSYQVITGNLTTILYQIKKFVEEAELMRDFIDFQYDGVVIQYMDRDIIDALGRSNAINNYAQAIKFNAMKKQTIFRGYTFTVGQDGYITPMIHYDPVEFMGTIHPKSSGHSLDRFLELGLRYGDVIDVEYVNDVMPYVYKPENSHNDNNTNPLAEFPTKCPICNTTVSVSNSGKSAYCPNINCGGRTLARTVNMLSKLDFADFAEASIEKMGLYSLSDILTKSNIDTAVSVLGEANGNKFMNRVHELADSDKWDYEILGAIGFDSLAEETWKLVLCEVPLHDVVYAPQDELFARLTNIKGIGKTKASVIIDRREYFMNDLLFLLNGGIRNMRSSLGYKNQGKKIRFTGFRNRELVDMVTAMGHDISDKSVTRDTDLLIVVNDSALSNPSGKVKSAMKYGVPIITLDEFVNNMDVYLE